MTKLTRIFLVNLLLIWSASVLAECMSPETYAKYSKICDQQNAADERLKRQVENECAIAGDIDRCMSIKLQGRIDPSRNYYGICAKVNLARIDFEDDKAYGRAPGTTCKNNLQTPPFDSSGKQTGGKKWGASDPYQDLPSINNIRSK